MAILMVLGVMLEIQAARLKRITGKGLTLTLTPTLTLNLNLNLNLTLRWSYCNPADFGDDEGMPCDASDLLPFALGLGDCTNNLTHGSACKQEADATSSIVCTESECRDGLLIPGSCPGVNYKSFVFTDVEHCAFLYVTLHNVTNPTQH